MNSDLRRVRSAVLVFLCASALGWIVLDGVLTDPVYLWIWDGGTNNKESTITMINSSFLWKSWYCFPDCNQLGFWQSLKTSGPLGTVTAYFDPRNLSQLFLLFNLCVHVCVSLQWDLHAAAMQVVTPPAESTARPSSGPTRPPPCPRSALSKTTVRLTVLSWFTVSTTSQSPTPYTALWTVSPSAHTQQKEVQLSVRYGESKVLE